MRLFFPGLATVGLLVLSACSAEQTDSGGGASTAIESIHTSLAAASCRSEIDNADPNATPQLVCPGVAGYSLIVRRVESGRVSIHVVDSAQRIFPLRYNEVVTRHMSSLADSAEWRVETTDGTQRPIALIVRVDAREDISNPEQITHAYWAVAKIAANEACVTDRIQDGERPATEVRSAADSARARPCASPQPPLTPD